MKLKVKRAFTLSGKAVAAGSVIDVDAAMAEYLLGLKKSPVEKLEAPKPASKTALVKADS